MTKSGMKLSKFSELVARIWSNPLTQRRDPEITIAVHSPGSIGASPSVEVESIQAGFDWDAGHVMQHWQSMLNDTVTMVAATGRKHTQ